MPTAYLKKLAEEGQGTIAELEADWDAAKADAKKQGQDGNYAYVTSIFKNRAGIKASVAQKVWERVVAYSPQGPNIQHSTPGAPGNGFEMNANDNAYLDSLVDSGQFTREEVDKAWAEAKKIADDNAKENPNIVPSYAYTTSIFQSQLGIKAEAGFEVGAAARLKVMAAQQEVDFDLVGNEAKAKAMLKALGFRIKSKVSFHDDKGNPRTIKGEYKVEPADLDELEDSADAYFYDCKLKAKDSKHCYWEIEGDSGVMLDLEYTLNGNVTFKVTEP